MVLSICPFLQLVWSAAGAPSCGFQSMGWTVGTTPQQCSHADSTPRDAHMLPSSYAHIHISSHPHMLTSSYAHIHISSYPQPQPASQPAGQPASQPGSIGRQVRIWGSKSANVTPSWVNPFFFIRVRRFLMVLGRRSAKVALKRVSSAQTRLGAPKTSKNVGHVCQNAACVTLERKELQRRHLSDLERLDPSEHQKTSDTYAKVRKWIFVTLFSFFKK